MLLGWMNVLAEGDLHLVCRCHFSTFKQCQEWLKRLTRAIARPAKPEDLFAFAYHAWCLGVCVDEEDQHAHLCRPGKLCNAI